MHDHPLHARQAARLALRLKERAVVLWYDPHQRWRGFIDELRAKASGAGPVLTVPVGPLTVALAEYQGSYFLLRHQVEPLAGGPQPAPLLIYLPTEKLRESPLCELEHSGVLFDGFDPPRIARELLRERLTDAEIDALLATVPQDYASLGRLLAGGGGRDGGVLRPLLGDADGDAGLLARWIAEPAVDAEIEARGGRPELVELLGAALGLAAEAAMPLPLLRERAAAWMLANEFRSDLVGAPPVSVSLVGTPAKPEQLATLRGVARRLRAAWPLAYAPLADAVEGKLGLAHAGLDGARLGTIDTFRCEEAVLLDHVVAALADGRFAEAAAVIEGLRDCFWLRHLPERRARWEAARLLAVLGLATAEIGAAVAAQRGDAAAWVEAYAADWHRLDRLHREAETIAADLDGGAEAALARVRQAYEQVVGAMAQGFAGALQAGRWTVPGALPQLRVYAEAVAPRPAPAAYFLIDSLRYEMGAALKERLPETAELSLRPALTALPSLTVVGMAALLPEAAADFTVVAHNGRLAARLGRSVLPDAASRERLLKAMVPGARVLLLGDVVRLPLARLRREIAGAPLVVVRSPEIDSLGESGLEAVARQAMDSVVGTIARAMLRLADCGIHHQTVAADHGHLFIAERGTEMRIDPPGGEVAELHRRCWAGQGGGTPSGCVRVSSAELGYAGELDFIFPVGTGVFRAGGDLAYHHGGISLQEMVVPVLTAHLAPTKALPSEARVGFAEPLPAELTARILAVKLRLEESGLFGQPVPVRPVLVEDGREVGHAAMAFDAPFADGVVTLEAGATVGVGLLLTDERARSVDVVLLDAQSGRVLGEGRGIAVRLGVM